ncbi:MAG: rhodanese-related sulfurtransferase [Leptolyngbya sp. UWPOB_LEPTO1]|uniref:oxygen-dependent tRNA uridine(34) hydroxylase TrhO n=1 Tax=Leptolyngbya sp. UWPOB_LEPTO1 TaxID=2815653 RepID=UPI001AD2A8BA|nr:rhodanese-related sulfurtransferase [Leptolyngbya sp. UWPOB_LEPTO1]MBN8564348.1 rhodanese-related sulfurtransferase [Leptolyngbya sp. UWPOB_LEPTO1]
MLVAAFYKFVSLPDYVELRAPLLALCQEQEIRGTILLAQEGINGTIAGSRPAIAQVLDYLRSDSRFADLNVKESETESRMFDRLKIKLKKEIVTLGIPEVDPTQKVGTYVKPQEWNAVISDPETIVIDVRNRFEVSVGSFEGAIDPETASFRQFPDYVRSQLDPTQHQKVAMFCTGGIRCEKASAYLLSQGFQQVYHLEGGILKYLEEVPSEESLWRGECFVFDQRVAVTQGVKDGSYEMCYACGHPISPEEKASPLYQEGISCPYCSDTCSESLE